MPKDLTVRPEPYRPPEPFGPNEGMGVFYPPKDYDKWAELIRQWARHSEERYDNVEEKAVLEVNAGTVSRLALVPGDRVEHEIFTSLGD